MVDSRIKLYPPVDVKIGPELKLMARVLTRKGQARSVQAARIEAQLEAKQIVAGDQAPSLRHIQVRGDLHSIGLAVHLIGQVHRDDHESLLRVGFEERRAGFERFKVAVDVIECREVGREPLLHLQAISGLICQ